MSRRIPKFAGWAVGLFVVLAMAFGATVAFATPANARSCANDGWNFLGEQISQNACFYACYGVHGEDLQEWPWGPINHCCRCLF
jgi:hypothetical protein